MTDKVKIALKVALPNADTITYPLAVVAKAKNPKGAQKFAAFVVAPDGQNILAKYGFQKP